MAEAFLVDAVRTPIGKRDGGLAGYHPAELAAVPKRALLERTEVPPGEIDDVQLGCVNQIGPQASCIARTAWLTAGELVGNFGWGPPNWTVLYVPGSRSVYRFGTKTWGALATYMR